MSDTGKFKLTVQPALPSKCTGCGFDADGRKEFIDTTMSLDFYGAVLFCEDCVREMAATIGMVNPENELALGDTITQLTKENELLEQRVEALEGVVFTYRMPSVASASTASSGSDSFTITTTDDQDTEGNGKFS